MFRFLHRNLLIPAFESGLKRRKTFRYWKELERSQWLSREEVERLQFDRLRRLISHAFMNCPYYREAWEGQGLDPNQLRSPEDFRRWPVIDRDVIREHRSRMRTTEPGVRLIAKSTGGSSGVPLHFDLDDDSNDRRMAAWHRGYGWAGAEPGTKQFYLWGVALGDQPEWKRKKDRLYNLLYRRHLVSTFGLSEDRVPWYLEQLNRHRPDVIVAYTNPLYILARSLEERGLKPFSPRSIVVGAEKLHTFQRELIERVFRAPVFETYGSREFMMIGAECDKHAGLHLTTENLLVEVLDDEGRPTPDGEEGNIVITDLTNFGMPFIRYINGDRAPAGWGTCSCGRGLPLLTRVAGRRLDVLRTPDGRHIPGELFPHLLKDFPAIRRFQVVQREPGRIEIRVVLDDRSWSEDDRRKINHEIREVVGPTVQLDLLAVDDIPLTAAGKHRVVVNLCDAVDSNPAGILAGDVQRN